FYDDYAKITQQSGGGTKPQVKLWAQIALALFVAIYLWKGPERSHLMIPESKAPITSNLVTTLMVPFYKYPIPVGAVLGLLLITLAIVGSSNAVNLTDGLDGLAIGCTVIVSFVFLVLTYLAGNLKAAAYLQIPYVFGAGELTVFCAALIGAGLGFLWFNCHPAQMFMGDTGSLALGGALGLIAVLIHQPLVLVIAGGVFVMEAVSVILQRGWFRYTKKHYGAGRRVFLMAPIHHHFEKKGWYESQVVMRFYILCVLFAVIALSTLKIR
ncbi:MAG: phospho-N-acetylmuramoyl-pentapeptide-transferase, partial [Verrucomicrobiota bacterium]